MKFTEFIFENIVSEETLEEAFSPADLLNAENWIKRSFANNGIPVKFSPHFRIRADERSNKLNLDQFKKIFAIMVLKNGLANAFNTYSDSQRFPRVKQNTRIIDFNLGNNLYGSVLVKKQNDAYEFETFHLGKSKEDGYLKNAPRTQQSQKDTFSKPKSKEERGQDIPEVAFNLGAIPEINLIDLIRQTREPNNPESTKNKFGYNYDNRLKHDTNKRPAAQLIKDYTETVVDDLAFLFYKELRSASAHENSRKAADNYAKILKKIQVDIKRLEQLVEVLYKSSLISDTTITAFNTSLQNFKKELVEVTKSGPQQFNNFIKQNYNSFKTDIVNYANQLKTSIFNDISAIEQQTIALRDYLKPFMVKAGFEENHTVSDFIAWYLSPKNELDARTLPKDPKVKAAVEKITENNFKLIQAVTDLNLLHNSLAQQTRQPDELGINTEYVVSPLSGNVIRNDDSARKKSLRASHFLYMSRNHPLEMLARLYKIFRYSIQHPRSGFSTFSSDLISSTNDLGTALELKDNNLIIEEAEKLLMSLQKDTNVMKAMNSTWMGDYVNSLPVAIDALKNNLTESTTMKHNPKIKKYADLLIQDLLHPSASRAEHGFDDDTGQWWDNQSLYYNPLKEIPKKFHKQAKVAAFKELIRMFKHSSPEYFDSLVDRLGTTTWIPERIYSQLKFLAHELESEQEQQMQSPRPHKIKGLKEDPTLLGSKPKRNPKYLGPTEKVKSISPVLGNTKRKMQVPLNKKGFGGS